MGPRHVGQVIGWLLGSAAAPIVLGAVAGRRGAWIGVACACFATGWLLLWLPRAAHGAFEAGRFARAARRYRVIGSLAFTRKRERAAALSGAGCSIAVGELGAASAVLDGIDPETLDAAERVVWLNNRACLVLEGGREADRAEGADEADRAEGADEADRAEGADEALALPALLALLALIEEATALRPDVPAIQHTRAKALLAVGRVDDAITVLDAMRSGGELPPYLEAERCRELALAWERKGQADYAADYRARARIQVR